MYHYLLFILTGMVTMKLFYFISNRQNRFVTVCAKLQIKRTQYLINYALINLNHIGLQIALLKHPICMEGKHMTHQKLHSHPKPRWRIKVAGIIIMLVYALLSGCGDADHYSPYADASDADIDNDEDADFNSDADSDTDTDSESDGDAFVQETEERFDYRIPVSSGKYVFIADKLNDKVIAVDSTTLEIFTTHVGSNPTHVLPLNDKGEVAVISLNADEVSIIRMKDNGEANIIELDIRPDTNALAVSSDGRYIVAFWDSLFAADSAPPATDQEISIIETTLGAEQVFDISVGIHPMQIEFNSNNTKAFVISEGGVDIIELAALNPAYFPASLSLFDYAAITPSETETVIDPTGTYAIGRREDVASAYVALLDDSQETRTYPLSGIPTDIDISADGTFGMFTIRSEHQVAIFNLPLPEDSTVDPFEYVDLGEQYCGAATLSKDGQFAALYTSVADDNSNRKVLTLLQRNADQSFSVKNTLLNRDIRGISPSPDSQSLIVVHEYYTNHESNAALHPYSYSLVKLPGMQSKFQQLPVDPIQMLTTEDGAFAYMLLSTKEIQIINLETFIVDTMQLGSMPTAAGYASLTDKIFISQEHPSGRMTFMDATAENVKTITGYTLNDQSTN